MLQNKTPVVLKTLSEILVSQEATPSATWQLKTILSEECMSYIAWNTQTHEALVIDPKLEGMDTYRAIFKELSSYRCVAVVDTHTHADHISSASQIADELQAPLLMHHLSPCSRVHLRVARPIHLTTQASPLEILLTPGHTADGITVIWGPFCFTGDTVFYGDVGRDDLPGGDPEAHYESLQLLKSRLAPETLICPGHDFKGGRVSNWATQLKINSSLIQDRRDFVDEARAFDAPAPALFKKSLFENFR